MSSRELVLNVLRDVDGNRTEAARRLNVHRARSPAISAESAHRMLHSGERPVHFCSVASTTRYGVSRWGSKTYLAPGKDLSGWHI